MVPCSPESLATGISDPLELVLPQGATIVPDTQLLAFPTVTSTVPEPSTAMLFGVGLVSLLVGLLSTLGSNSAYQGTRP